ncbi:MAG: symporter small accessory protein [Desulfotomaculales bacterium]
MADPWIAVAWLLTIASALLCVVYGVVNYNKGGEGE